MNTRYTTRGLWITGILWLATATAAWAQPTVFGSALGNGSYAKYELSDRGVVRAVRIQASTSGSSRNWEFARGTVASTDYSINWRPYTVSQTLSGFNSLIDPSSASASARYNTGFGGQSGLLPAVTADSYYTVIVGENAAANNFLSILETAYLPRDISSVESVTTAFSTDAVGISVTLSGALQSGEKLFVRYTTNNWSTSELVEITSLDGSNSGEATIPAQTAGTTVQYYALTSNTTPTHSNADYFTLNLRGSGDQNVGTNFSYTTVSNTWATAQAGNWSEASTWLGNQVPSTTTAFGPVIINHDVSLNQTANVSSITIAAGKVLTVGSDSLKIAASGSFTNNGTVTVTSGVISAGTGSSFLNAGTLNAGSGQILIPASGTFQNNGTFNASSGTVVFAGTGTVSGTSATSFNNLTISGGLTIPSTATINGRLTINGGGFVAGTPSATTVPNWGASSTIRFNASFEINSFASGWSTASGRIPANLEVNAGTLTLSQAVGALTGSVTIASGATLAITSQTLSAGSVTNGGTLSLTSGTLSIANEGSFTNNGTFTRGTGTVSFAGNGSFGGSSIPTFNNLTLAGAGTVAAPDNFTVNGALTIASGATFDAGSHTLTFGDGATLTNNGTFTRGSSTVHFLYDGAIAGSSATGFHNLIVDGDGSDAGGVLVPNTATIHNKLTIASGGYLATSNGGAGITTNAALPEYAAGATLAIEGSFTIDASSPYASGWGISGNKIPTNVELGAQGRVTFSADLADNKVVSGFLKIVNRRVTTNNKLTFLSDAYFDPASVDSLDGNVNFQRSVTGSAGWRMLAAPTATTISDLLSGRWTQGFAGSNFPAGSPNVMLYNGTAYAAPSNLSDALAAGSGLIAYIYRDDVFGVEGSFPKTLDVSGARNTGNIAVTLNSGDESWTVAGNPFSTPIDADLLTRTEMQSTVYVWNTATSSYYSWNGTTGDLTDGLIAPFQAFWIRKSGAGGSALTIPTSARVTTATTFRGKEERQPLQFRLKASGSRYENTAWFSFSTNASAGTDGADAFELWPLSEQYAMLYSVAGNEALEINHLPVPAGRLEIPVAFEATDAGMFTLSLGGSSLPEGWRVSIRDAQTGRVEVLSTGAAYSFEHAMTAKAVTPQEIISRSSPVAKAAAPRFTLILEPDNATSSDEGRALPTVLSLEQNFPNPFNPSTSIAFTLPAQGQVKLSVFDMNGRQVDVIAAGVKPAGRHTLTWNAATRASGVYLLKLEAAGQVLTRKMTLLK